jgi:tetratricopeptide (TPR) repeat protein
MKHGQELEPLSLSINVAVGWAFYLARRYDEAIEQLRRTIELDPNYPVTYWILGPVLRKTGCYELAITEGEKGVKLSGGSPLMRAALAHTLGTGGRTKEALQMLEDLSNLTKQSMSRLTSSQESTLAWEKTTARWNIWRDPTKSTPTGLSIFI